MIKEYVVRKASINEKNNIKAFYRYVTDNTKDMDTYGRWEYGKHPTDDVIDEYIDNGYMYVYEEEEQIIGTVAVTFYQGEEYRPVSWKVAAEDDEVAVIHLLCIAPNIQRGGYGKRMVQEIINLARENTMKAVRLDALCCNIPAHKLYESLGFEKCGVQKWYASNTGYIDFFLYEYKI